MYVRIALMIKLLKDRVSRLAILYSILFIRLNYVVAGLNSGGSVAHSKISICLSSLSCLSATGMSRGATKLFTSSSRPPGGRSLLRSCFSYFRALLTRSVTSWYSWLRFWTNIFQVGCGSVSIRCKTLVLNNILSPFGFKFFWANSRLFFGLYQLIFDELFKIRTPFRTQVFKGKLDKLFAGFAGCDNFIP